MILALSIAGLLLAALPAGMFLANLPLFRLRSDDDRACGRSVSVLIPARDEEQGIESCLRAALASQQVEVEVVVLDDHSSDRTAERVQAWAAKDARVRYVAGKPLPSGWNGKQFACSQLAESAACDRWLFIDADVRLQPDALHRLSSYQDREHVDLLSAFPFQETGSWLEKWLVPMMHVILLGYLPLQRMRQSKEEAYAAGCGQMFLTTPSAYRAAGGHAAIKDSRHDGLKLPRAYRRAGLTTDVIDGTELASCRMYHSAAQVVQGVLKNAHEGIANPRLIVPFSILLLGSAVLPLVVLVVAITFDHGWAALLALAGVLLGHFPRLLAAIRFRQSYQGVWFHSAATLLFVVLQWIAWWMHRSGRTVAWRGRRDS